MRIYLDHNATSPTLPEVAAAMARVYAGPPANPASTHSDGRHAAALVEAARGHVARLVGAADPASIVFTSGGTEADVLALRGTFEGLAGDERRRGLITSAAEHPAVLETAERLGALGWATVHTLEVGADGLPTGLDSALGPDTRLVSLMAANNETGVCLPLAQAAEAAHRVGALLHTDAVQALGKVPLSLSADGVDLASFSAHKIGGPQGVGALFVRPGRSLAAQLTGGGQEGGLRSGTLNVAGVVGFGEAARIAHEAWTARERAMRSTRDRIEAVVRAALPGARVHGADAERLPNTLSLTFPHLSAEALVMMLDADDVAASLGSACSAGSGKPSHVLVAMGVGADRLRGAIRISTGPGTTLEQAERAAERIVACVRKLDALAGR
jgi:cysteine desulfurase